MEALLMRALGATIQAGMATLEVYRTDFSVVHKTDDSPLTLADQYAHDLIMEILFPLGIPILSEEGRDIPYEERKKWRRFWLVDPLDGTKEFIKKNDEFTVNIALIENHAPVMGIICVPALGVSYFAEIGMGAFKLEDADISERIASSVNQNAGIRLSDVTARCKRLPLALSAAAPYTIVGSRSHGTPELAAFVEKKRREYNQVAFISAGSSLKFCQVAEGRADIYPRFGPTMEWDTAAGQAIAGCAGASVLNFDTGAPLVYNKENLVNPWFIVTRPPQ